MCAGCDLHFAEICNQAAKAKVKLKLGNMVNSLLQQALDKLSGMC